MSSKQTIDKDKAPDGVTTKEPEAKGCDKFKKFAYNKETGEVFGRSGNSWLKIFIFYVIFYIALAAFFFFFLFVSFCFMPVDKPKYNGEDNMFFRSNPGMSILPTPEFKQHNLIFFNVEPSATSKWTGQLKHLDKKTIASSSSNQIDCGGLNVTTNQTTVCKFNVTGLLGNCTSDNHFGYTSKSPCVVIKLNRIYGWTPQTPGKKKTIAAIAKNVTDEAIQENPALAPELDGAVMIHCKTEEDKDKGMIESIKYYPMPGIPKYYFPFLIQKGYVTPYVMVQFQNITAPDGKGVAIECRAYADNIAQTGDNKLEPIKFTLQNKNKSS